MKRRDFVEKLGAGSAALLAAPVMASPATGKQDEHAHAELNGPLANATIGFGAWKTDFEPPLDRFPNVPPPIPSNQHQLLPRTAVIRRGGSVNFIISGLHQIIVYAPGKRPADVDSDTTTPTTGTPAGVPLIDDPEMRVYRGPDPSLFPFDRSEVVHFARRGTYLVICGVRPHFLEGMFGFVRVL